MSASCGQSFSSLDALYGELGYDDLRAPKADLKRASKTFRDAYHSDDGRRSMHIKDWEQDANELTIMAKKFLHCGNGLKFWWPRHNGPLQYPSDNEKLINLIKHLFYQQNNHSFKNDRQRQMTMTDRKAHLGDRLSNPPVTARVQESLIFSRKFELRGAQYQSFRATFAESTGSHLAPVARMVAASSGVEHRSRESNQLRRMANSSSGGGYPRPQTIVQSALKQRSRHRTLGTSPSDTDDSLCSPSDTSDDCSDTTQYRESEEDGDYCDEEEQGDDDLSSPGTRNPLKRTMPHGINSHWSSPESTKKRRTNSIKREASVEDLDQDHRQQHTSKVLAQSQQNREKKNSGSRTDAKEASGMAVDASLDGKTRDVRPSCKECRRAHSGCTREDPCLRCRKKGTACIYPEPPISVSGQIPQKDQEAPVTRQPKTTTSINHAYSIDLPAAATDGGLHDRQESSSGNPDLSSLKPMSEQAIVPTITDAQSETRKHQGDTRPSSPSDRIQGELNAVTANPEHGQGISMDDFNQSRQSIGDQGDWQVVIYNSKRAQIHRTQPLGPDEDQSDETQSTGPRLISPKVDYYVTFREGNHRYEERWEDKLSDKDVYTLFESTSTHVPGKVISQIGIVLSCREEEFFGTFVGRKRVIERGEHEKLVELQRDVLDALQKGVDMGARSFSIHLNLEVPTPPTSVVKKAIIINDF